ncbi:hypothetical protein GE107_22025 [Cohnella sp. CFH 77786]|uniref:hypothetical protein n=1 Tax=Cohnella sp. CFH 77786 TaxID=2662265 RepID=UPI001C60D106|nr:hypothetical protein [Cohnella sp. CFH 77786]MBW5448723.1 hypothetical protein [Cohnella sp. CFH 77786]
MALNTAKSTMAHLLVNRNHVLLALAWIGDEDVIRQFTKWRENPPPWASKLYVPPENYTYEAEWELDQYGRKRMLFHSESGLHAL